VATCVKFSRLFSRKNVLLGLKATAKNDVIKEVIETLERNGVLDASSAKEMLRSILAREEIGSTGIGNGVAVPHAKVSALEGLVVALARSDEGLDFHSVDGEPVHLLFFVASPPDEADQHLQILESIAKLGRNGDFRMFARRAKNVREIQGLLREMVGA